MTLHDGSMAPVGAVDVVLAGAVFFDLVMGELDHAPAPGTEVYARELATAPGGIANLAVATARLGLRTDLITTLGDDIYGRWCREFLVDHEGIDLSRSRTLTGWPTPLTVSLAHDGDRSMITREEPAPPTPDAAEVPARAAIVDLRAVARDEAWLSSAARGTLVFADLGWDPTGRWDPADLRALEACHAFTPNEREATAYTRTDTPVAAARALAERVPLVVVTCGAAGAVAIDAASGEEARVPAVPVRARDATGAGDVFGAALVAATLEQWPLAQRVAFAALCAGLAVEGVGGSISAPGWGDIADWRDRHRDGEQGERYGFLDDALRGRVLRRRADAAFPFATYRPSPSHHPHEHSTISTGSGSAASLPH